MKTILLVQHAAAVGNESGLEDTNRPLTADGKRDAELAGALLRDEGIMPEAVLCSTALRARSTAAAVTKACGFGGDLTFLPGLYEGGLADYIAALRELRDETTTVMLVGHNPAIQELVTALGGTLKDMPDGAVANLRLAVDGWSELHPAMTGGLQNVWYPAEFESRLRAAAGGMAQDST